MGYPCVYVSQRFCADHAIFDAVARVGARLYPVLPCLMDPAYCSVWNAKEEPESEKKVVRIEILSENALLKLRPATVVDLHVEGVDPNSFGGGIDGCDLDTYVHSQLDGGLLGRGQALELLCNGRKTQVEVLGVEFES